MSQPFIGEIRTTSFNFAPSGWALCNGQLLAINANQALFAILGTTYGGDGTTNFALPNLQGRMPMHSGNGVVIGQTGGAETVTLTSSQLPVHTHALNASSDFANTSTAAGAVPAAKGRGGANIYLPATTSVVAMDPSSIAPAGGSQAHNNMPPYGTLNFVIALQGIFPSRN